MRRRAEWVRTRLRSWSDSAGGCGRRRMISCLCGLGVLRAFGTSSHVRHGFVVQTLALVCVPERLAHDPPGYARTEIVRVIEPVHRGHHLLASQIRILEVRQLLSA